MTGKLDLNISWRVYWVSSSAGKMRVVGSLQPSHILMEVRSSWRKGLRAATSNLVEVVTRLDPQ